MLDYEAFIKSKAVSAARVGFDVQESEVNPLLKPHQNACVRWAIAGGRRALFEAFGLGKSVQQLEAVRLVLKKLGGGRGLIVLPLGVRQEFKRDAAMLGIKITFVRRTEELHCPNCDGAGQYVAAATGETKLYQTCNDCDGSGLMTGIFITNYESVRDKRLDLSLFDALSLDEGSCLRSFGSKTFSEFLFENKNLPKYRFVATATPSPNEFQELLAYAHFLGIMDIGQARTRFFKRNSEKSDDLTLHKHKEEEFWLWVSTWALFLQKPSDLGFSDEGYALPEMKIHFRCVQVDHSTATPEKNGQGRLFRESRTGMIEAAREKRDTLSLRVAEMRRILDANPNDSFILWHDLEAERYAIEKAVPDSVSVYGSQDLDEREQCIIDFSDGKFPYLAAKPVIAGSGCNFQRHCHKAIFLGIGFKFNDFIQAIHRIHRFLQTETVEIYIIYAESEAAVLQALLDKWERDKEQRRIMQEIIKKYGLTGEAMKTILDRAFGVERIEFSGERFKMVNWDAVLESRQMEENSVGLVCTSIPFSTQYEYSPNYNDFGHTDDNEHFFAQMDFLTPELFRILSPGRIAAIHVKDRIVPSGMTGLGFQVVYPFHVDVLHHYQKHGFQYMGMKTIVTDVVRENNQTYRLGWTEQCKDGTKMGYGMPEYLMIFRKPPTDNSNSYADIPVIKSKDDYSRSRWQIDAHGFARSNGDRLLSPEDLEKMQFNEIYKLFRAVSISEIYDYEFHVRVGEMLDAMGKLPVDFMLLPPQSWHPEVWTDITRMKTLNASQAVKGKQMHLCPMQFDIADRVIVQMSNPGDIVFDPFAGIGTVPYRAVKLGRFGYGCELAKQYFIDAVSYCQAAEYEKSVPTLFDITNAEKEEEFAEKAA